MLKASSVRSATTVSRRGARKQANAISLRAAMKQVHVQHEVSLSPQKLWPVIKDWGGARVGEKGPNDDSLLTGVAKSSAQGSTSPTPTRL